jgi:hypothetical protein
MNKSFALETQTGKTSFEWGSIFSLWKSLVTMHSWLNILFLPWPKKYPLQMREREEIGRDWGVGGRPTTLTLVSHSSTFSPIRLFF